MVFSSLNFIFIFLPLFLAVYAAAPAKHKNTVLLTGSLVFYICGTLDKPLYLLLLVLSAAVNYAAGRALTHAQHRKKLLLFCGILYNFGWLFVFKYADFLFGGLNELIKAAFPQSTFAVPQLGLLLPVGISFYTFQAVSYLTDVYRGTVRAETSPIRLGTYICMYPQLVAGPIVTYASVARQLQHRNFSLQTVTCGLKTFIRGLGYKVLLANQIGNLWNDVNTIGYESISAPLAWMGAAAFTFQIYFDFYGYSLMAIGLGEMLGFKLPQNFNRPYSALTMTDFWRRWHITLGSWFRTYVYIPLGGNRKGRLRTVLNLLTVWLFTGIWHGASLNFLLWGFVLFALIALEKTGFGRFLSRCKIAGHIYMLFCIPLSWMLFAITDLKQISLYFSRLFPFFSAAEPVFSGDFLKYSGTYGLLLAVCLLFCTKLPGRIYARIQKTLAGNLFLLVVFWASVYCLYIGLNDPFLYFRF